MSASIQSLVHRGRRQISRFLDAPESSAADMAEDERPLGLYQNADGGEVMFTTEGLRINRGNVIRYRDMAAARVIGEKADASRIELILADGSVVIADFDGGKERFRDVWEMLRLLDRIRAVVQRIRSQDSVAHPTPRGCE